MVPEAAADGYVVVGAGSAGRALAARLSADPTTPVLRLEAGAPNEGREISFPAAFPELFRSAVDCEYYTDPREATNNRKRYWPRGRTLGGSSAIDAMVGQRDSHPGAEDSRDGPGGRMARRSAVTRWKRCYPWRT